MSGLTRPAPTHRRWRPALRAGVLAAGLALVVGAPLTAQAAEWEHHGWRGHEWREHHEWHPYARPYAYGYVGPSYYYGPSYGYYAPAPTYGYGYAYPGVTLNFHD